MFDQSGELRFEGGRVRKDLLLLIPFVGGRNKLTMRVSYKRKIVKKKGVLFLIRERDLRKKEEEIELIWET